MLSAAERKEIDQEVTAFMAEFGHMFGASLREGIQNDDTSNGDTSTEETNTQPTRNDTQEDTSLVETSARRDRFAHFSPELASHARAIERFNFLKRHCPWSQDEAFMNMMCSLHDHPQTMGLPPSSTEPSADESSDKGEERKGSPCGSQLDAHAESK